MDYETREYIKDLQNKQNKQLMISVVPLCLIIIILIMFLFTKDRTYTRLVPPGLANPTTMGQNFSDEEYLAQMARYMLFLRFNVQPETAKNTFGELLNYVRPALHADMESVLMTEADRIKEDHITSSIFIRSVEVNVEEKKVIVVLISKKAVGKLHLPNKLKTYEVEFEHIHGVLALKHLRDITEE